MRRERCVVKAHCGASVRLPATAERSAAGPRRVVEDLMLTPCFSKARSECKQVRGERSDGPLQCTEGCIWQWNAPSCVLERHQRVLEHSGIFETVTDSMAVMHMRLSGHACGRHSHLNTSAETGTKRVGMVVLGRERQGAGEAQGGVRLIQGVQGAWGTWLGGAWHLQSAPRGYSIASGSPRRPASAKLVPIPALARLQDNTDGVR